MPLIPGFSKAIQIGRTIVKFSLKAKNCEKNLYFQEQAVKPKPVLKKHLTRLPTDAPLSPEVTNGFVDPEDLLD